MPQNRAVVKIDGKGTGAKRAADMAAKGLQSLGKTGKKTGDDLARASESAAKAEKKFEAEVQKSIQALQRKETRAKATAEAEKRLGIGPVGAQGGGARGRPVLRGGRPAAAAPGGGRVRSIFEAASRGGGAVGGVLGQGASALGAATPAMVALGGAAVAATTALAALTAASDRAAEAAGEQARLSIQRREAVRQAQDQVGGTAVNAAAAGGSRLRQLVGQGVSLGQIANTADRVGIGTGQAAELASLTKGLSVELRNRVEQAFSDANRLGGSGLDAARFASTEIRDTGGLGNLSRSELALQGIDGGAGTFGSSEVSRRLRNPDLIRLAQFERFGSRQNRAEFRTILDQGNLANADAGTQRAAERTRNPVRAALDDINKAQSQAVEVLEAQADASFQSVELLKDIKAAIVGGEGSFGRRAAAQREFIE
jgi:hypothetical protein